MSEQRAAALESLRSASECEIVLVTPENLHDFLRPENLHPAYPFLNLAHRSDYLRCYFMKVYGSGYCDIKPIKASWRSAFTGLAESPDIWMVGYPETGSGGVANLYSNSQWLGEPVSFQILAYLQRKWLQHKWQSLTGCGAYICKPDTPLVTAWWSELNVRLDRLLPRLQRHPAQCPRDGAGGSQNDRQSSYPVPWTYLNGAILQPLCLRHSRHISNNLPTPIFRDYL